MCEGSELTEACRGELASISRIACHLPLTRLKQLTASTSVSGNMLSISIVIAIEEVGAGVEEVCRSVP